MKKARKYFAILLALVMTLTAFPLSGLTASAAYSGDFEYVVLFGNDKHCGITHYSGEATTLTIPSKIDGYTVISIGKEAFANCASLTDIIIPDSVTNIEENAFAACTSLKSVTIGNGVTSIIDNTFYGCVSLANITIGNSVTSIGNTAFDACYSIANYTVSCDNSTYASENGVLFNKDKTNLLQYPMAKPDLTYTVPANVQTITEGAFYSNLYLEELILQNGVVTIEDGALKGMLSLKTLRIPATATYIGGLELNPNAGLSMPLFLENFIVDPANTVYSSENGVLFNKNKTILLQYPAGKADDSYSIPDSVQNIVAGAFLNSPTYWKLQLELIEKYYGIPLEEFLQFYPAQLRDIYLSLYNKALNLQTFSSISIPNSVTSIGDYAFFACASLTSVTIGNDVKNIGDYAFYNCTSLTNATIGNSVTHIGDYAFYNCTSLTNATIGNSVTYVGNYAFYSCILLENVYIPNSVTNIGEGAFIGCSSLKAFYVNETNQNYCSIDDVLFNKKRTVLIQYPARKLKESYIVPNSVTTIGEQAFANCSSLINITLPNGLTSIATATFNGCDSLININIPNSVTSIGDFAFNECASITNLTLPNSVTKIGNYAFYWCDSLTSINIPDRVTVIGDGTFAGCDSLTSITLPDNVISIGGYAFNSCDSLTRIVIPEDVTSIGGQAFSGCEGLTIYGYAGSYAETYGAENDIPFVALTAVADAETGVTIESTSGYIIPENAALQIESVAKEESQVTYNISLTQNGVAVQPSGEVTVKIPVPATMDGEQCEVYREEEDGTKVILDAVYRDGYMVFTTDVFGSFTLAKATPSVALGDVNGDGTIDAADAVMIQRYDSGLTTLTDEQLAAADVNADGLVDAADAVKIQRYDAGLIATL